MVAVYRIVTMPHPRTVFLLALAGIGILCLFVGVGVWASVRAGNYQIKSHPLSDLTRKGVDGRWKSDRMLEEFTIPPLTLPDIFQAEVKETDVKAGLEKRLLELLDNSIEEIEQEPAETTSTPALTTTVETEPPTTESSKISLHPTVKTRKKSEKKVKEDSSWISGVKNFNPPVDAVKITEDDAVGLAILNSVNVIFPLKITASDAVPSPTAPVESPKVGSPSKIINSQIPSDAILEMDMSEEVFSVPPPVQTSKNDREANQSQLRVAQVAAVSSLLAQTSLAANHPSAGKETVEKKAFEAKDEDEAESNLNSAGASYAVAKTIIVDTERPPRAQYNVKVNYSPNRHESSREGLFMPQAQSGIMHTQNTLQINKNERVAYHEPNVVKANAGNPSGLEKSLIFQDVRRPLLQPHVEGPSEYGEVLPFQGVKQRPPVPKEGPMGLILVNGRMHSHALREGSLPNLQQYPLQRTDHPIFPVQGLKEGWQPNQGGGLSAQSLEDIPSRHSLVQGKRHSDLDWWQKPNEQEEDSSGQTPSSVFLGNARIQHSPQGRNPVVVDQRYEGSVKAKERDSELNMPPWAQMILGSVHNAVFEHGANQKAKENLRPERKLQPVLQPFATPPNVVETISSPNRMPTQATNTVKTGERLERLQTAKENNEPMEPLDPIDSLNDKQVEALEDFLNDVMTGKDSLDRLPGIMKTYNVTSVSPEYIKSLFMDFHEDQEEMIPAAQPRLPIRPLNLPPLPPPPMAPIVPPQKRPPQVRRLSLKETEENASFNPVSTFGLLGLGALLMSRVKTAMNQTPVETGRYSSDESPSSITDIQSNWQLGHPVGPDNPGKSNTEEKGGFDPALREIPLSRGIETEAISRTGFNLRRRNE